MQVAGSSVAYMCYAYFDICKITFVVKHGVVLVQIRKDNFSSLEIG